MGQYFQYDVFIIFIGRALYLGLTSYQCVVYCICNTCTIHVCSFFLHACTHTHAQFITIQHRTSYIKCTHGSAADSKMWAIMIFVYLGWMFYGSPLFLVRMLPPYCCDDYAFYYDDYSVLLFSVVAYAALALWMLICTNIFRHRMSDSSVQRRCCCLRRRRQQIKMNRSRMRGHFYSCSRYSLLLCERISANNTRAQYVWFSELVVQDFAAIFVCHCWYCWCCCRFFFCCMMNIFSTSIFALVSIPPAPHNKCHV